MSAYLGWLEEGRGAASTGGQGSTLCSPADLRPLGGNLAAVSTEWAPTAGVKSHQCQLQVRRALLDMQPGCRVEDALRWMQHAGPFCQSSECHGSKAASSAKRNYCSQACVMSACVSAERPWWDLMKGQWERNTFEPHELSRAFPWKGGGGGGGWKDCGGLPSTPISTLSLSRGSWRGKRWLSSCQHLPSTTSLL